MGFTKLDEGLLFSSVMQEKPEVFKVWIALLAACKEDGIARVSSVGLSGVCFLPLDVVQSALIRLEDTDKNSRTTTDEGKRIRRVDGGYFVINYHKYRELSYKEKDAERKYISYHKKDSPEKSGNLQKSTEDSASASLSTSEEKKEESEKEGRKCFIPPTIEQVSEYCKERNNNIDPNRWMDFYTSKGWMIGKNKMKDWKAAVRTWEKPKEQTGGIKLRGAPDKY